MHSPLSGLHNRVAKNIVLRRYRCITVIEHPWETLNLAKRLSDLVHPSSDASEFTEASEFAEA